MMPKEIRKSLYKTRKNPTKPSYNWTIEAKEFVKAKIQALGVLPHSLHDYSLTRLSNEIISEMKTSQFFLLKRLSLPTRPTMRHYLENIYNCKKISDVCSEFDFELTELHKIVMQLKVRGLNCTNIAILLSKTIYPSQDINISPVDIRKILKTTSTVTLSARQSAFVESLLQAHEQDDYDFNSLSTDTLIVLRRQILRRPSSEAIEKFFLDLDQQQAVVSSQQKCGTFGK